MKRSPGRTVAASAALVVLWAGTALAPVTVMAADGADAAKMGKEIAFDRKKGNCLACHQIDNGESPGNIAPPLVGMKARYPDRAKLKAQLWNPQAANPDTAMPPFGKHKILTDEQIERVVDYVWGL